MENESLIINLGLHTRDIFFRGKRADRHNEWVEGNLSRYVPEYDYATINIRQTGLEESNFRVMSRTVGQYTGYNEFVFEDRSKNKPIFEHDIVEVWAERRPYYWNERVITKNDTNIKVRGVIVFRGGYWQLYFENNYNDKLCEPRNGEKIKRCLHHWENLSHYGWGHYISEENLKWYIEHKHRSASSFLHDIVVIGNIFDNPDMLE